MRPSRARFESTWESEALLAGYSEQALGDGKVSDAASLGTIGTCATHNGTTLCWPAMGAETASDAPGESNNRQGYMHTNPLVVVLMWERRTSPTGAHSLNAWSWGICAMCILEPGRNRLNICADRALILFRALDWIWPTLVSLRNLHLPSLRLPSNFFLSIMPILRKDHLRFSHLQFLPSLPLCLDLSFPIALVG